MIGAIRVRSSARAAGVAGVLVLCAVALGCASGGSSKPKAAPAASQPAEASKWKDQNPLAFDQVWIRPNTDYRRFTKVYVAPVDVDLASGPQVENVALAVRQEFAMAISYDRGRRFRLVSRPGEVDSATLVLRPAIVSITPEPGGAIGSVVFEARNRDGETQELLGSFRGQHRANIVIADPKAGGNAVFGGWAAAWVALASEAPAAQSAKSSWFQTQPW